MRGVPRVIHAVVYGALAIICYGVAQAIPYTWLIGLLLSLAILFVFTGLYCLIVHWQYVSNDNYIRRVNAESDTPEVRMIRALSTLTDAQIAAYRDNLPVMHMMAASPEMLTYIDLSGERINGSFVREFLLDSVYGLPAVRSYSDGSRERRWAQVLTGYIVNQGWADHAIGPYSAQWVDGGRERALKYFDVADTITPPNRRGDCEA